MKIFLIGFMGSGKTVFGKKLAAALNLDFADLDRLVEENYQMSIPGIFSQFDENVFRSLESKILADFVDNDNFVLSCGGGTPCFNNNMEIINSNGISIYIKLNAKTLADRLIKSKTKRPLIENVSPTELVSKIEELLLSREYFYTQATLTVDGIGIKITDVSEAISDYINRTT